LWVNLISDNLPVAVSLRSFYNKQYHISWGHFVRGIFVALGGGHNPSRTQVAEQNLTMKKCYPGEKPVRPLRPTSLKFLSLDEEAFYSTCAVWDRGRSVPGCCFFRGLLSGGGGLCPFPVVCRRQLAPLVVIVTVCGGTAGCSESQLVYRPTLLRLEFST